MAWAVEVQDVELLSTEAEVGVWLVGVAEAQGMMLMVTTPLKTLGKRSLRKTLIPLLLVNEM
jgi:hypothetical protein